MQSNRPFCLANDSRETYLSDKIGIIVDKLVSDFSSEAILADGSLGRGEMTVLQNKGDNLIISDCDLQIVTEKRYSRIHMLNYSSILSDSLGMEVNVRRTNPEIFYQKVHKDPKHNLERPSISTYERKYSSRTLFGKDFTKEIPEIASARIPVWEGIRLLYNRIAELLEYAKPEYVFSEISGRDKNTFSEDHHYYYWKNKCMLACIDALLLGIHKYHWSIKKKKEYFESTSGEEFGGLFDNNNELLEQMINSIEYKMSGKIVSPHLSWSAVVRSIELVFLWLVSRELNIRLNSVYELPNIWLRSSKVRMEYYRGPTPSLIYQNSIVLAKLFLFPRFFPSPKLLLIPNVFWAHVMYSQLPLILLAPSERDGRKYLRKSRNYLSNICLLSNEKSIYPGKIINSAFVSNLDDWIATKDIALWIHGHAHNSSDYVYEDTRVVCNPFGYLNNETNRKFISDLIIDV